MDGRQMQYPDNSEILARKAEGRREDARATLAEKIAILERMRERVAPIVTAGEARRANQAPPPAVRA